MNILITGGTGFVGRKLVEALCQNTGQHRISVLTRWPENQPAKEGVSFYYWNALAKEPIPIEALAGVEAVVNLMGENLAAKRWSAKQKQKLENSRIEGTRTLLKSLEENLANSLKVFISAGAIGYYPVNRQEILTESSPAGTTWISQLCFDWEAAGENLTRCARKVTLRIGVVLGCEGGALAKMLLPFRLGLGGPIGGGQQTMSWIHQDDLIYLITSALQDSRYRGVYNAVSPLPRQQQGF